MTWTLLQIVILDVTSGRDAKRTILYALDSSLESGWWAIDVRTFVWSCGGHTMSKSPETCQVEVQMEMELLISEEFVSLMTR